MNEIRVFKVGSLVPIPDTKLLFLRVRDGNNESHKQIHLNTRAVRIGVNAARLASGFEPGGIGQQGEGDIYASYSADTIATSGKIRKAFRWQAQLMVTVSLYGRGIEPQAEAYQLVPIKAFSGTPQSYEQKILCDGGAEAARNDPNGFYHGMSVKQGREIFVLSGPPVVFVPEVQPTRPEGEAYFFSQQLGLF